MKTWMKSWIFPLMASLGALLHAAGLAAATHVVQVNDDVYVPNDLTIQVGDTVRWNNEAGGRRHDVSADDGTWASELASSFVYERTFNSVGEILYFCSLHSSPGQNRNTSMNGRIVVQGDGPAFTINAGLNDTWFNPQTGGQGFFISVFPDIGKMFLAWFTFDTARPAPSVPADLGDAGHRWVTAFGDYAGDTAILDVEITRGGVFNSPTPAPTQTADGTITVTFSGCNSGEVLFDIPSIDRSGAVPIQRVSLDNVPACEAGQ